MRHGIILTLSLSFSSILSGQELALKDVLKIAVECSPRIQSLEHQVRAREGAAIQAAAVPVPEFGVVAGNRTRTLELGQELEYPGKRNARTRQAEQETRTAESELTQARSDVEMEAAGLFYDVLWAEKNVVILEENLEVTGEYAGAARYRFDRGFSSRIDAVKGRMELNRARRLLVAARREESLLEGRLKSLLNAEASRPLPLKDALASDSLSLRADADSLVALACRIHPAVLAERRRLDAARIAVEAARLSSKPDFGLSLTGGVEDREPKVELGIRMPLALWDPRRGAKIESRFLEKSRESETERVRVQIAGQVRSAYREWLAASETVKCFDDSTLTEAEAAAEYAGTAFRSGAFRFLDLLDARRTVLDAKLEYWQALRDLRKAEANLLHSAGLMISEGGGLK
jgi:outer membrane protein TolC